MNQPSPDASLTLSKRTKKCTEREDGEVCGAPVKALGKCAVHYMRMRRRGEVPARVALYPMTASFSQAQLRALNMTARENGVSVTALLRALVQSWMNSKLLSVTAVKS